VAAPCQPLERDPALRPSASPYPPILEPVLAQRVGIPVALSVLWTWFNPRIFPAAIARSLDIKGGSWGTCLAEPGCNTRTGLSQDRTELLSAVSGIGMLVVFRGVLMFDA
jgi:hypothetical protein